MSEASVSCFFEEFKVLKLSDIAKLMRVSSIKRYTAGELSVANPLAWLFADNSMIS